jgi:hypothetical protein
MKSQLLATFTTKDNLDDTIKKIVDAYTIIFNTINALNECIKNLNNGVMDEKFMIPWENFKNMLMVTNSEGLNKINTRIYKIEKIEKN